VRKHKLKESGMPWYQYVLETVLKGKDITIYWDRDIMTDKTITHNRGDITIYWDRDIMTDKTITHNRGDITLVDKRKKPIYLLGISIPNTLHCKERTSKKWRIVSI
jgi:hypothetical protein